MCFKGPAQQRHSDRKAPQNHPAPQDSCTEQRPGVGCSIPAGPQQAGVLKEQCLNFLEEPEQGWGAWLRKETNLPRDSPRTSWHKLGGRRQTRAKWSSQRLQFWFPMSQPICSHLFLSLLSLETCIVLFSFPSAPYTNESCHLQHEASAARIASVSHVLSHIPAWRPRSLPRHPSTPASTERWESPVPPQLPQIQMVCKTLTALTGYLSIQNITVR